MKFLVIFLAVLLLWRLPLPQRSASSRGFKLWLKSWRKIHLFRKAYAPVQYALVVVLPTALIVALGYGLDSWLWGLPSLALEVALLVYVLMHANSSRHLDYYQQKLEEKDFEGAYEYAVLHLGLPNRELDKDPSVLNEQVIKALLHRWFEYFFLMLFWYLLADVGGIVLAWLSIQYARGCGRNSMAERVVHWLEVLPARLLGLTYGLAGSLTHALPVLGHYFKQWQADSADLLFDVANSALALERSEARHSVEDSSVVIELKEWQRLHNYCVSIWLVILAIITLGGWVL